MRGLRRKAPRSRSRKTRNAHRPGTLPGQEEIDVPTKRRKLAKYITVKGCKENNLKNIDVKIPIGLFTVVNGVSGSGKSTLVYDTRSTRA